MTAKRTRNAVTESSREKGEENERKTEKGTEIAAGAIGHGARMLVAMAAAEDRKPGDRTDTEREAVTETIATIIDVMMTTIGEPALVVEALVARGITAENEVGDLRGMIMAGGAGIGARIVIVVMTGTDVAAVTLVWTLQNGDVCVQRADPGADQEVALFARTQDPGHGHRHRLLSAVQQEMESQRQQPHWRQVLQHRLQWTQRFWRTSCGKSYFASVCYSLSRISAPAPTPVPAMRKHKHVGVAFWFQKKTCRYSSFLLLLLKNVAI